MTNSCQKNCSACGACSANAKPVISFCYSGSCGSGSGSYSSSESISSSGSYSSDSSIGSYSGSSSSGSYGGSSYTGSLDAMVSNYQGASSSGDYSSIAAAPQSYAINLDSIASMPIYENRIAVPENDTYADSIIRSKFNQDINQRASRGVAPYGNAAPSNNTSGILKMLSAYGGKKSSYDSNSHNSGSAGSYKTTATPGMLFTPSPFLKRNRPATMFVGEAYEIQDWIKEAFKATTGKELPKDVLVEVCSKERLREIHEDLGGRWSPGIQGFAINKKHMNDTSLIFISKGPLDKVMLTIGHEIGHVMSNPLVDKHAEEAKAFAFSIAWMKAIKENNIAGLEDSIELDTPANNGLHNVALDFVLDLIKSGRNAMDVFVDLIENKTRVTEEY